jgi:uncharacterized protein YecE (DUF72 family)
LVYSAPRGINYLKEYAQKYNTVEIDQWFWSLFEDDVIRLPRKSDVEDYRRSVPDDFRFTIKVPNSITLTHYYKEKRSAPLVSNPNFLSVSLFEDFLSRMEPLWDVAGALIFQFEYLNKQKMASEEEFFELIRGFAADLPPEPTYAIEIRNPNYVKAEYFTLLGETGWVPVLLQGYWMPSIVDVYRDWHEELKARGTSVIRLHGPDRQAIEEKAKNKWNKIVADKNKELGAIAQMINHFAGDEIDLYINVNNHYEGSAPLTIEKLKNLLGR